MLDVVTSLPFKILNPVFILLFRNPLLPRLTSRATNLLLHTPAWCAQRQFYLYEYCQQNVSQRERWVLSLISGVICMLFSTFLKVCITKQ
jgi:hypothetical protein